MRPIPVGAKGSFSLVVRPEHLANRFKDATLPPVLATPVMIMMMENAALNAIKPYLDAGESAVGTRVDVQHLAATPAGRTVSAEAEVTRVTGKQVAFLAPTAWLVGVQASVVLLCALFVIAASAAVSRPSTPRSCSASPACRPCRASSSAVSNRW